MADDLVSVDEYCNARKGFVRDNGTVLKVFKAPPSLDKEKRTARFVMSTEEPDRDRDIIVQAGLDTTEFMKNPVALYGHRSWEPPIGKWSDITRVNGKPKRTEGTLEFLPEGTDDIADRIFRHVSAGSLRAVSIGFMPKRLRRREQDNDDRWPGYEITESELFECSVVTIPANAQALVKDAAGDPIIARELVEEALDTWARDPATNLLIPREEFEKTYRIVKLAAFDDLLVKAVDKAVNPPEPEPKPPAAPETVTLKLAVDTSEAEAAIERTSSMVERLGERIRKFLGLSAEPEVPAAPSPADIEAARKAAEATLARLQEAGRI